MRRGKGAYISHGTARLAVQVGAADILPPARGPREIALSPSRAQMLGLSMQLTLPRSTRRRSSLGPVSQAALAALEEISRQSGGIIAMSAGELSARLRVGREMLKCIVAELLESRHIMRAFDGRIAIVSEVSANLHRERVANNKRRNTGRPCAWPLREKIAEAFPDIVSAKPRRKLPLTNKIPSAFLPILRAYESHHLDRCPPDVERITEGYIPGELTPLLTAIDEQASANREVVLLYTRKAVYVAIRRRAKR